MAKDSLFRVIAGASFLMVLMGLLLFLYSQSFTASSIFPQDTAKWNNILTGYLIIFLMSIVGGLIFVPKVIRGLATANYWKSFGLKFIPTVIVYVVILTLIRGFFTGFENINIFQAISYMPLSVLLVYLIVVVQVEELLFGGLIYTSINNKYGYRSAQIITVILFALFHFAKTGGSLVVMATYIPLRFWWDYQRNNGTPLLNKLPVIGKSWFGATPQTQQSNAGAHGAWDIWLIGMLGRGAI